VADDVTLPGTGSKVLTDEHSGGRGHMQVIKLAYSADGDATMIGADGNGLDVDVTRVTGVVAVSDNGGALTVDDGGASITVDGTVAISGTVPVSDNGSTLSVDDAGTTLSIDDGAGSLTVDNAILSVVGGGTEATAQRVTIASDSTGVLSVDDNGGSLTVDGTVTIQDGGNVISVDDAGSTLSIDDGAGSLTIDGVVSATQSGTWTVQPGNTANTTAWLVKVNENGLSQHKFVSNGTAFATSVTAASTVLYQARCYNRSTTVEAFLKLYNRADTPDPSAGHTNVSIDPIPVAAAAGQAGGFIANFGPDGIGLTTGFGFVVVTDIADTNEGAAGNNNVVCNFLYRQV
jgi:hypothetical protein